VVVDRCPKSSRGTCYEARLHRGDGPQFDAGDRARSGRSTEPAATTAQQRQNGGQTSTEVGTDVVVDERVDTRIAVGENVADDAEHRECVVQKKKSERKGAK